MKSRQTPHRLKKGSRGSSEFYLIVMFLLFVTFAFYMVGGKLMPKNFLGKTTGTQVLISPFASNDSKDALQLENLRGATVTAGPTATVPNPTLPTNPPSCVSTTSDTVLVIDHSGSVDGTALQKAKLAAKTFIDIVSVNPNSRVGLVQFDDNSEILSQLTSNFTSLKSSVDQIPNSGGSCVQCGAKNGNEVIAASPRAGVKKSIVLLTDGRANHINGVKPPNNSLAEQATLDEALAGFAANGTAYYPVGFGGDGGNVNTQLLQTIANQTGGSFYLSPTEDQLVQAFTQIASQICQ